MIARVNATVFGDVLKLDRKLEIADETRVNLTIEPLAKPLDSQEAWQSLKVWIVERPLHGLGRRLTRDQLHERR